MTFSSKVKDELSRTEISDERSAKAEAAAFVRTVGYITIKGLNKVEFEFLTENFVQIGMRSYNSPEHYHFIKDSKITLIPANQVLETSIEEVAKKALEVASRGTDHIYMSVDIDVLDSAFAPGSGANEPGGLTSYQLFKFVKLVAPYIDAIDIVEVNPLMDYNNMTSIVASKLLFDYIISNYYANEDSK